MVCRVGSRLQREGLTDRDLVLHHMYVRRLAPRARVSICVWLHLWSVGWLESSMSPNRRPTEHPFIHIVIHARTHLPTCGRRKWWIKSRLCEGDATWGFLKNLMGTMGVTQADLEGAESLALGPTEEMQ